MLPDRGGHRRHESVHHFQFVVTERRHHAVGAGSEWLEELHRQRRTAVGVVQQDLASIRGVAIAADMAGPFQPVEQGGDQIGRASCRERV